MSGLNVSVTKVVSFGLLYLYLHFICYIGSILSKRRGRDFRGMRSRLKSIIYAPRFAWKRRANERQVGRGSFSLFVRTKNDGAAARASRRIRESVCIVLERGQRRNSYKSLTIVRVTRPTRMSVTSSARRRYTTRVYQA